MEFRKLFQLLAVLLFVSACSSDDIDKTIVPPSDIKENSTTKVEIEVSTSTLNLEDKYAINTILGTTPISETECEIQSVYNDLPQLYFVTDDNDNIILISRKCISKDEKVVINEETTALALATLNPLFVGATKDDFNEIETLIKSTNAYNSYLDIVKQTIEQQKNIFDTKNFFQCFKKNIFLLSFLFF